MDVDHPVPTVCDCGRMTEGGGACDLCVRSIRAIAEAEANPPPPPPPEPPEIEERVIHPPGGCFRCGASNSGMLCDFCNAELHGLPRREGDPIIKFPKPLTNCGY